MVTGIGSRDIPTNLELISHIEQKICQEGGFLPFDCFMQAALYQPQLGYYTGESAKISDAADNPRQPKGDFITAPELSPLFGFCVARQIEQILAATKQCDIWEFGAGSGKLAADILTKFNSSDIKVVYHIVDVSNSLKARQQQKLAPLLTSGVDIRWHSELPEKLNGVVIGNELLDALPVKILHKDGENYFERGVTLQPGSANIKFAWAQRKTALQFPLEPAVVDYVSEIHPTAVALIKTLAEKLETGAMLFIDYGFDERQYYHPQRSSGTLMCHFGHRADTDPLVDVGLKDITAHVNFTAVALAGQDAGLEVLGYVNQANFLFNCGILSELPAATTTEKAAAEKLLLEHEMGELFKVIALGKNIPLELCLEGFSQADISYRL